MNTAWPRSLIVAAVVLIALCATALAQPHPHPHPPLPPPGLPTLVTDVYPAESRREIDAAYQGARADPDNAEVVGALAMWLQAWHQFDAAAATYARAQSLAPDAVAWWYLGGVTADRRAFHTEAIRQFERAEALAPGTPLVSLRLADAQLANGQLERASSLYTRLVAVPECAAAAWYGLGRVHMARKNDADARASFERALAIDPTFGAAHYALAQVQRRAGDHDAARLSLARQRQCLACWPMPNDPWQSRVDGLRSDAAAQLTRGVSRASAGTAAAVDAIRLHEAALSSQATRGQAHVNLIELYGRTGNLPAAREHYQAASSEPGFAADALRTYGLVLLSHQTPGEALALLTKATDLSPRDAAAYQGMGLALEMLDRADDAVRAYQQALDAAPGAREARFGLARIAMRRHRTDQAIAHLEELREPRDADAAKYFFALSVAYVQRGQIDAGLRVAHEALDLARQFDNTSMVTTIEAELRKLQKSP